MKAWDAQTTSLLGGTYTGYAHSLAATNVVLGR